MHLSPRRRMLPVIMFLQPMMITALLAAGMGVALLGSVKVALARRLHIDEARVGGLVSIFGFTMIPIIFAAGFLTDSVPREVLMIGGSVLFAASLVLLGRANSYRIALLAVVLMSAGWATMINVGNVLTPSAFPGTPTQAANLANVFFGSGAFLTPIVCALLVGALTLPVTLGMLGAFALAPGILAFFVDFKAIELEKATGGTETSLVDPVLLLCGFGLFFYGPLEASLGAWTTTYLGERGVGEGTAARLLSAFWLAYLASRLLVALTVTGHEALLILLLALASIAVLGGMVWSRGRGTAMLLVVAAGFVFGPIFPTLMGILLGRMAPEVQGRAVGVMFGIGGIGWTLIPMLIGAYARRTNVQRGFRIAVGAAFGLTVVGGVLLLR